MYGEQQGDQHREHTSAPSGAPAATSSAAPAATSSAAPSSKPPTTGQKLAAEVLGTLVLVFFGVGAALMSGGDYLTTGLAFGLTVLVMAAAVGRISGGHFNPAVTLGAALGGRLAWRDTPLYVGAQLFGGLLAGALLFVLMHGFPGFEAEGNMGQNAFGDQSPGEYAWWAAMLLEILLTTLFVWVILGVTDSRNSALAALAPVAIGMMLALVHFASMSATGTSVNPARSIGVGVFAGTDAIIQLWLFVVAPLLGGAFAGVTYPLIFGQGAAPVPGSGIARAPKPQQPAFPPYGQPGPGTPWGGVAGQPQPGRPGVPPQQPGTPPATWGPPTQQPGAQQPGGPPQGAQPWGSPAETQARPGQADSWGAPGYQAPQQPYPGAQPGAGQWGAPPPDDEDGRTQVRPGG